MQIASESGTHHLAAMFASAGGVTGAFSSKAADYAESRPGYPAALFDALRSDGTLRPVDSIADVGAGTGLFTAALLERGYSVTAVEPNAGMLAVADALLLQCAGYRSVAASAEATTLPDSSFDVVTCAQAFHWFDVDAVRREWLRILKSDGRVVLTWNTRPLNDPLQAEFDSILGEFGGERHSALTARQELTTVPPFFAGAAFRELTFPNSQCLERKGFVSLVLSRSTMPDRASPAGKAAEVVASKVFERFQSEGSVTVNYSTLAFVGRPANV